MQGQPLTNEEIAAMTGAPQAAPVMTMPGMAAPVMTQGAQSFAMPDMFASPGLTMVGGTQGEFSGAPAPAAAAVADVPASPTTAAATSSKKKSDKKKSSKKKLSSKKKSKGCC